MHKESNTIPPAVFDLFDAEIFEACSAQDLSDDLDRLLIESMSTDFPDHQASRESMLFAWFKLKKLLHCFSVRKAPGDDSHFLVRSMH